MTVKLTPTPSAPLPGIVRVQLTTTVGNYARVWATSAPRGSSYAEQIADAATDVARLEVITDAHGSHHELPLDVGGVYVFTAQEFTRTDDDSGYPLDPRGLPAETKNGAETTIYVRVANRLTQRIGSKEHGYATLLLYVQDDAILTTSRAVHGVDSPAIIDPTSQRAEIAAQSTTVAASLAALKSASGTNLSSGLSALITEIKADLPGHFNDAAVHAAADTTNDTDIENLPDDPSTPEGYAQAAAVIARRLSAHMSNIGGSAVGAGGFHSDPDYTNAIIANTPPRGSQSMAEAWASIGDSVRAFNAHSLEGSPIHTVADTRQIAASVNPLLTIHKDFLAAMQPLAPTVPANMNEAAVRMMQLGFTLER
jgi:hypothetical protein